MKKNIKICTLLILSTISAFAQNGHYLPGGIDFHDLGADPFNDNNWKKVFSEEFNQPAGSYQPNVNTWDVRDAPQNGSLTYDKASNVKIMNGNCNFYIKPSTNGKYSVTEMGTIENLGDPGGHKWERGMFEARIKMPRGHWTHNTFWVWNNGSDCTYSHTPTGDLKYTSSEIDVIEHYGSHRKHAPMNLHHFYDDINHPNYDHSAAINGTPKGIKVPFRLDEDFHIYTAIWDKYFIYFYFDHVLKWREARFIQFATNDNAKGYDDQYAYNNFTSAPGYYWNRDHVLAINEKVHIIIGSTLDDKNQKNSDGTYKWNWATRLFYKQFNSNHTTSPMKVDWIRVYQINECERTEEIVNSNLQGYFNLSEKRIIAGTGNNNPLLEDWKNIAPNTDATDKWGVGQWQAESIILKPNFMSYPEVRSNYDGWEASHPENTAFLYTARSCPENIINEYIDPTSEIPDEMPPSEEQEIDTFDCSDVDTALVDSMIAAVLIAGDTLTADSIISYLVDTLGCEYWGDTTGGSQGKYGIANPNRKSHSIGNLAEAIRVYPNPTNGSFTIELPEKGDYDIRIVNIIGVEVHKFRIDNERKRVIELNKSLQPGSYTVYIKGVGIRHIEKIILMK